MITSSSLVPADADLILLDGDVLQLVFSRPGEGLEDGGERPASLVQAGDVRQQRVVVAGQGLDERLAAGLAMHGRSPLQDPQPLP